MPRLLVTGGTGMLGRHLVPQLVAQGHEVRVLSRKASPAIPDGAVAVQGNVRTGEHLVQAVNGVDTIVHAATDARRRPRQTEVRGTRLVIDAARSAGVGHVIYVSIVGVDRIRFPYYRAKWEAERVVESSGLPWTIQRATQFHDLLDHFLGMRIFMKTPNLAFQVVDPAEVAARLTELVGAGPSGRSPDFGGPEVLPITELNSARGEVTGRRAVLVRAPGIGFVRDFDEGHHLCPDHRDGVITWRDWLGRGRR